MLTIPNDAAYTISTVGGAANPATSLATFTNAATFTGAGTVTATPVGATSVGCGSGACPQAQFFGSLFGPQAAGVGISYAIGAGNNQIAGAVAFARTN